MENKTNNVVLDSQVHKSFAVSQIKVSAGHPGCWDSTKQHLIKSVYTQEENNNAVHNTGNT